MELLLLGLLVAAAVTAAALALRLRILHRDMERLGTELELRLKEDTNVAGWMCRPGEPILSPAGAKSCDGRAPPAAAGTSPLCPGGPRTESGRCWDLSRPQNSAYRHLRIFGAVETRGYDVGGPILSGGNFRSGRGHAFVDGQSAAILRGAESGDL